MAAGLSINDESAQHEKMDKRQAVSQATAHSTPSRQHRKSKPKSMGTVSTGGADTSIGTVSTGEGDTSIGTVSTGEAYSSMGTVSTGEGDTSTGTVSNGESDSSMGAVSNGEADTSTGTVSNGEADTSMGTAGVGIEKISISDVHVVQTKDDADWYQSIFGVTLTNKKRMRINTEN